MTPEPIRDDHYRMAQSITYGGAGESIQEFIERLAAHFRDEHARHAGLVEACWRMVGVFDEAGWTTEISAPLSRVDVGDLIHAVAILRAVLAREEEGK